MPRWTSQEQECIDILKNRLKEQLDASPKYPEIVGERKMIRFLRGHNFDVDKVYNLMVNFFNWRIKNNVNEIRKNIVEGGMDHPLKFPKGELILSLIPQLILVPNAQDKQGCPICVEQYNFTPSEVFKYINIDDYILFVLYSLEFKSLVVEALSEQREQAFLNSLTPSERAELETNPDSKPYGVIVNICVVRDLNGVGFAHLSAQGQEIIKAVIAVASDNYPELMRKCFMINAPFLFNAAWYVIKGFLAPRTLAKVSLMGSSYMNELLQDIDRSQLPVMVGGDFTGFTVYEPYVFDRDYFVPEGSAPVAVKVVDSNDTIPISSSSKDSVYSGCEDATVNTDKHVPVLVSKSSPEAILTPSTTITMNSCVLLREYDNTYLAYAGDGLIDSMSYEEYTHTSGVTGQASAHSGAVRAACNANLLSSAVKSRHDDSIDHSLSIISMRTSGI